MARHESSLRELLGARDVFRQLAVREIRGRHRGTLLGQGWSLVNPLIAMAVYTVVFGRLLDVSPPPGSPSGLDVFALWVLCGLLPWLLMANSITGGLGSLVGNAPLVTKVWFPREVLVASVTAAWFISFCFEMSVLVIALVVAGHLAALAWAVAAAAVALLLLAFASGLALAASVLHVYFRDTGQLVGAGLQVWFYATPVVYPASFVPERFRDAYELNPMYAFVSCFRALLYDGRIPAVQDLLVAATSAVLALVLGYLVFQRFEARLGEEL